MTRNFCVVVTQIKVRLLKNHHKLIPKHCSPTFQHFPSCTPTPLFLHPAPGHVLFIGISPQSAVLIVHLCRSRGAACNMVPVIICAHCVPRLKNILQTHTGRAADHCDELTVAAAKCKKIKIN